MARRANGEGCIYKKKVDSNGKCTLWGANIMIGYKADGKKNIKIIYGKTQKEVKQKLEDYKREMLLNTYSVDHDNISLADYYYTWLMDKKPSYKATSFKDYETVYRLYLKNRPIGNIKLKKLSQMDLKKQYRDLMKEGTTPHTIHRINTKLKVCLNTAIREEIIIKNPCSLVELPKITRTKKREVLTAAEQTRLIEAIQGHKLELLYIVALATGMRLGEILGLKWQAIDFTNNTIEVTNTVQKTYIFDDSMNKKIKTIEQTPKTENGTRSIPLPVSLIPRLRSHRKTQLENKLKYGQSYNISDYVFTDELGRIIDNKKPNRNLQTILKKLGIEPIKFHGLRKTYATRLFENGVPPKTVQTLLGHADIQTTLNIYTEVMDTEKQKAVDTLNNIFNF
ncbi:MAG: site-specific integrase [Peptostreptococcus sp.]|uniref:tyrosine-type recombinase/integrase n=1 Tax=Peptostreptococcus sp. TaxID=1262 RepID=UPI0029129BEA|nr:site-specific integrase [Peptostreptococcus sp.]MDU5350436.1 site-specific integrase [Peptostreptococcus sp.]MDU5891257.1 site-specific integrase [Peptostreptococcus sp.]